MGVFQTFQQLLTQPFLFRDEIPADNPKDSDTAKYHASLKWKLADYDRKKGQAETDKIEGLSSDRETEWGYCNLQDKISLIMA